MTDIKIIQTNEELTVFSDEIELDILDINEENILAECSFEILNKLSLESYPDFLTLQVRNSTESGLDFFDEIQFGKENDTYSLEFHYHFPNKYWEGRWGQSLFLATLKNQVEFTEGIEVIDFDIEDDWKRIVLRYDLQREIRMEENLSQAIVAVNEVLKASEISLGGFTWLQEYETNEDKFCKEILRPLLNRMRFLNVRYTHGTREYGKDFTFSEMTAFGDFRHYGLQAKAGDIRGGVNSEIDELLGQLSDSFSMPYYGVGSMEPRYISVFIIAISGRFTDNAKEKIVHKMPRGLTGSVYFLDKESILELIHHHWHEH